LGHTSLSRFFFGRPPGLFLLFFFFRRLVFWGKAFPLVIFCFFFFFCRLLAYSFCRLGRLQFLPFFRRLTPTFPTAVSFSFEGEFYGCRGSSVIRVYDLSNFRVNLPLGLFPRQHLTSVPRPRNFFSFSECAGCDL